jgi:hypothetical protein
MHFRHMLEARHFIIFTDHKPITYAVQQKRDKCSPRQFNYLDFFARSRQTYGTPLSRRIRHCATILRRTGRIAGQRLGAPNTPGVNHRALRLEKLPIPGTTVSIYYDTSVGRSRP